MQNGVPVQDIRKPNSLLRAEGNGKDLGERVEQSGGKSVNIESGNRLGYSRLPITLLGIELNTCQFETNAVGLS